MQITFEEGPKGIIYFIPNHDILPTYEEIDVIIRRLQKLKKEMTNKEIKEHNKRRQKEIKYQDIFDVSCEKEKIGGYIYIVKIDNAYKIGRCRRPKERFKQYITENPKKIKLILCKKVNDYIQAEIDIIDEFRDKNIRGEWFDLATEDIKFIKNNILKRYGDTKHHSYTK